VWQRERGMVVRERERKIKRQRKIEKRGREGGREGERALLKIV